MHDGNKMSRYSSCDGEVSSSGPTYSSAYTAASHWTTIYIHRSSVLYIDERARCAYEAQWLSMPGLLRKYTLSMLLRHALTAAVPSSLCCCLTLHCLTTNLLSVLDGAAREVYVVLQDSLPCPPRHELLTGRWDSLSEGARRYTRVQKWAEWQTCEITTVMHCTRCSPACTIFSIF